MARAGHELVPAGTARTALGLRSTWFTTGGSTPAESPVPPVSLALARPRVRGGEVLLQGHRTCCAGASCRARSARAGARSRRSRRPPTAPSASRARLGETPLYRLSQGLTATPAVRVSIALGARAAPSGEGVPGAALPRARRTHRRAAARGPRRLDLDRPRGDRPAGPLHAHARAGSERRLPGALRGRLDLPSVDLEVACASAACRRGRSRGCRPIHSRRRSGTRRPCARSTTGRRYPCSPAIR